MIIKPLIIANWKCNPGTLKEAQSLFTSVKDGLKDVKNIETVICPPFVYFLIFQNTDDTLKIGAQDCFWEKSGAFTGEISPTMLKDLGCQYVILGHSERRIHFEESDEIINKKIKTVISLGLKVIFCIGETETERKKNETEKVLEIQIEKGLNGISEKDIENIVIAYEPVWAVGTGNFCSYEETKKSVRFIRQIITNIYLDIKPNNLRILYGGSVNSENAAEYFAKSEIQGFIIGGASLKPDEFLKIVKTVS